MDVTGANYAKDFELTDHNGQVRHLTDFKGKVVVMFFGFTQCPDVCPTSMAELAEVKQLLGKDGDRLQGLFVTVDPERDTPEVLKAYMGNFDPTFLALYTTPEKLAVAWPRTTRCITKRWKARHPPATPWTTPRAATSTTRKAICACSPATAAVPRCWRPTSPSCSKAAPEGG